MRYFYYGVNVPPLVPSNPKNMCVVLLRYERSSTSAKQSSQFMRYFCFRVNVPPLVPSNPNNLYVVFGYGMNVPPLVPSNPNNLCVIFVPV